MTKEQQSSLALGWGCWDLGCVFPVLLCASAQEYGSKGSTPAQQQP